jgi:A/G-specific adenine glycosylase
MSDGDFAVRLLRWFETHGRHDLPWQHPRSAYRAWISEVMLQQTQVATVIPYFERFVARFPDLATLAAASVDEVLALWSGLGYYSRGRNLHRAAGFCIERHGGDLPDTLDALVALPGIGRSTAAAILAQAHGQRAAILDGNVKRVIARHAGIEGVSSQGAVERQLWAVADKRLPQHRLADYTQALMDLGASVCTPRQPRCTACPVRGDCIALATDRVALLPTPKPRKTAPERSVTMLVLIDAEDRVLFERRPPLGLWGGLLGLPEYVDADTTLADLACRGISVTASHIGPPYRHVFTHFKLDITPLVVEIDCINAIAEATHEWHPRSAFADLALPTAVRRVLERSLGRLAE